jgi:hypothetical protein
VALAAISLKGSKSMSEPQIVNAVAAGLERGLRARGAELTGCTPAQLAGHVLTELSERGLAMPAPQLDAAARLGEIVSLLETTDTSTEDDTEWLARIRTITARAPLPGAEIRTAWGVRLTFGDGVTSVCNAHNLQHAREEAAAFDGARRPAVMSRVMITGPWTLVPEAEGDAELADGVRRDPLATKGEA